MTTAWLWLLGGKLHSERRGSTYLSPLSPVFCTPTPTIQPNPCRGFAAEHAATVLAHAANHSSAADRELRWLLWALLRASLYAVAQQAALGRSFTCNLTLLPFLSVSQSPSCWPLCLPSCSCAYCLVLSQSVTVLRRATNMLLCATTAATDNINHQVIVINRTGATPVLVISVPVGRR